MPGRCTIAALVLTASFVVTACSASGGSPGTSPAPASQGPASAAAGAVAIGTASSASLGTFLTGANGMTLYTHAGDGPQTSTCRGACAKPGDTTGDGVNGFSVAKVGGTAPVPSASDNSGY